MRTLIAGPSIFEKPELPDNVRIIEPIHGLHVAIVTAEPTNHGLTQTILNSIMCHAAFIVVGSDIKDEQITEDFIRLHSPELLEKPVLKLEIPKFDVLSYQMTPKTKKHRFDNVDPVIPKHMRPRWKNR